MYQTANLRRLQKVQTAEASMTQTIHSTQIVSPSGTGYVHEDHGPAPALEEHRKRSRARIAIALTVALFGATTAAAAIAASNRSCSSVPKLWQQTPPSILKLPGAFGPDEMLF
jgi:hypothetical protein